MAVAFPPGVERWRKPLEKISGWVPINFLLAWIQKESGGRPHVVSSLGERGLFQVHKDEVPFLKITDEQFANLTKDARLALQVGVKQAKLYARFAKRFLADVGAEWHGQDFWKLVKLHHGAFAMPKYALLAFQREHGRGPKTWSELKAFVLDAVEKKQDLVPGNEVLSAKLHAIAKKVFDNADEVGSVVPVIDPETVAMLRRILPVRV